MCLKYLLNPNDYMVKLDLKDAYLTVGVHPHSQQFLRFIWQGNLVPRACDPREGTRGSGIIRFREESDWPLK
jgi:hypothetical protein